MSLNPEILAALKILQTNTSDIEASTGIVRPPDGTYDCLLSGFKAEATEFIWGQEGTPNYVKCPAIMFQMVLTTTEPPSPEFDEPLEWPCRRNIIPVSGVNAVPNTKEAAGKRKNIQITTSQVKGMFKIILDDEYTGDLARDAQSVAAMIGSNSVILRVRLKSRTVPPRKAGDEARTYQEETVLQRIA